jgi:hypothetical protein
LAIYIGLKIGGFGARAKKKTVKDGDVDVQADGAIPIGNVIVANGRFADDAQCADGGALQIVFGTAEFLRGGDFILKRRDFRTLQQSLLNEREDVKSGGHDGGLFFDELKILFVRVAKNGRERGKRGLVVIPGFQKQELPACQVDARETQIEVGLQLGVG